MAADGSRQVMDALRGPSLEQMRIDASGNARDTNLPKDMVVCILASITHLSLVLISY